jgi:hypothetical protein
VGDEDRRLRSNLVYISGPVILIIGVIVIISAFASSTALGAVAVALVGPLAYVALRTPYEATLKADNRLVFRSYARKRCFYLEDVRRIERKTGHDAALWVFSCGNGSSTLPGEAGRGLEGALCSLNPRIVTSYDLGMESKASTILERTSMPWRPQPEADQVRTEPEWVRRGEMKSAQDLARQDREASRGLPASDEASSDDVRKDPHTIRNRQGKSKD